MIIGRRTLLIATGCVLVSRQVRASDDQIALYWTVSPPGRRSAVLFGYDRVAAALTPEIINDGISLVDGCQRVVIDMPENVKFPTVDLDRDQIKPILQVVAPRDRRAAPKIAGDLDGGFPRRQTLRYRSDDVACGRRVPQCRHHSWWHHRRSRPGKAEAYRSTVVGTGGTISLAAAGSGDVEWQYR